VAARVEAAAEATAAASSADRSRCSRSRSHNNQRRTGSLRRRRGCRRRSGTYSSIGTRSRPSSANVLPPLAFELLGSAREAAAKELAAREAAAREAAAREAAARVAAARMAVARVAMRRAFSWRPSSPASASGGGWHPRDGRQHGSRISQGRHQSRTRPSWRSRVYPRRARGARVRSS
jgi:hypothetical protein